MNGIDGTTGANLSFLDRLYTCSGLQISKQLYSREDIVGIIVKEAVDSVLRFLPSHMPLDSVERDGEQTNEFLG